MHYRRHAVLLGIVVGFAALGGTTGTAAPASPRLSAFHSCGELLGYAKSQAGRFVGPWGLGGGAVPPIGAPTAGPTTGREAAPTQGVDYSGTNVQEEGVDEPDIVKTNGTTLFAVANGMLRSVDVSARAPRLLDSLKLDAGWSHELLLHGDRLLVLSRGGFWLEPLPAVARSIRPWQPSQSVLTEVDVSKPGALRVVRTMTLDGAYVTARLVGRSVRVVATSVIPSKLPFAQPTGTTNDALAAASAKNKSIVASSGVRKWLPSYRLGKGSPHALVQCRRVSRPPDFAGLGMLTVLTIDLAKGLEPVDSVAVMTDARIVYASPESLYVATERWAERPDPAKPTVTTNGVSTALHRFDISSPTKTQYRASGSVPGFLLSQWSLSERRGVLRVVSTETPAWWGPGGESESFLTTLREKDGALVQAGRVGDLGKGERVYAVRFIDDVGYVVTFRQVDPLYTVDVSTAERPRVLGALKIQGYSAYLHPIGNDLLLGIGQDANADGRPLGTQLSIFDVSNLRQPTRLYQAGLGQGWSEAENDHHAFLFWPRTGTVVVPFQQQAVGFRVGRSRGIDELGRIENDDASPIRRSVVVRDTVLTVSDTGVKASSLATLADLGWVPFPAAQP
jgi:uncharacterized secreted protein with C-terminal beta-propeller domain